MGRQQRPSAIPLLPSQRLYTHPHQLPKGEQRIATSIMNQPNQPTGSHRDGLEIISKSQSDRIVDRKIERRALPESFSFNLGKKLPMSEKKALVRAMVSLFENPTEIPDKKGERATKLEPKPSDQVRINDEKVSHRQCERERSNQDNKPSKRQEPPSPIHAQPKLAAAPFMFSSTQACYQVEDYSLTLLKHKSYFNNRPLARCLDDQTGEDVNGKAQRTESKKKSAGLIVNKRSRLDGEDHQISRSNGTAPPERSQTSSPVRQPDHPMNDLLTCQSTSSSDTSTPDLGVEPRDPEEADRFWKTVRTRLWVEEVEIYEQKPESAPAREEKGEWPASRSSRPRSVSTRSYYSVPEPDRLPPPVPSRPPPPIPATARRRSASADPSRSIRHQTDTSLCHSPVSGWDITDRDELLPVLHAVPSNCRFEELDIVESSSHEYAEPELPALLPELSQPPSVPAPAPAAQPGHSRNTTSSSSGSSGPWTRPPTWRSPLPLTSSSPPPVPPLPSHLPPPPSTESTSASTTSRSHRRHRHQPAYSKASASTFTSASISTHSVAATDNSSSTYGSSQEIKDGGSKGIQTSTSSRSIHHADSRSIHSNRSKTTTPKTSTNSIETRRSPVRPGTDGFFLHPRAAPLPPTGRPRRLTTEEKLSEIDAFFKG